MVRHISWSQLSAAHTCEWRWALKYMVGAYRPTMFRAPTIGSAIHECIAAYWKRTSIEEALWEWFAKEKDKIEDAREAGFNEEMLDEAQETLDGVVDPALAVTKEFMLWIDPNEWEVIQDPADGEPIIEKAYSVEIMPGYEYMIVVDLVAKNLVDGLTRVIDWKVRTSAFNPPDAEETSLQKASYQYVLGMHGIKTDASAICQIWHAPPAKPAMTQKGVMSVANIRTTWETYATECVRQGFDPDDYEEKMRPKCNPIEDFFRFDLFPRSYAEVEHTWENVVLPRAQRIRDLHTSYDSAIIPPVRALGSRECHRCIAKDVCMETLRGRSWEDALICGGYKIKPKDLMTPIVVEPDDEDFTTEEA